jgi:hypothetical protein
MQTKKKLYKVIFQNHGKVYELYAKRVEASDLYGFTFIADLVFDSFDSMLVDPTEERLKEEFNGTQGLHLPMHSIVRVEEVAERGIAKIRDASTGEKIMPFPGPIRPPVRE